MLNWKSGHRHASLWFSVAMLCAFTAAGCGTEPTTTSATPQGTIALDKVKVGMPEASFKDATLTFVVDPNPNASVGGKTQYVSRTNDEDGGQYLAQCLHGQCFELQVYHMSQPIPKDAALKVMKRLFPTDLPEQSRVDDKELKSGKDNPTEVYYFGDQYRGELIYADKGGTQVKFINAWYLPKSS